MKEYLLLKLKKFRGCGIVCLVMVVIITCSCSGLFIESFRSKNEEFHEVEEFEEMIFPEGFIWGAATAAHQVEGGNTNNDWYVFEQEGKVKDGQVSGKAADHYNRYEQDFDLMKELNLNSYRFSIEWSRIEPEKGRFNENEIEHYREVLSALKERGITPMVTLHHFSNPIWFSDMGGWENNRAPEYFAQYCRYVASKLGDEVEMWITINEPLANISSGYIQGKWPPGEQDIFKVPGVFSNLVKAHNEAYKAIHQADSQAEVGVAEHTSYNQPYNNSNPIDVLGSYLVDKGWNRSYLDAVRDNLDFIGLHYYYRNQISSSMLAIVGGDDYSQFEESNLTQQYYPEGLYYVLKDIDDYNVPIYITENGTFDSYEIPREQYIRDHLVEIWYAIENGVDVRGYYYWALLDSFEWAEGFDLRFGLIYVDFDTFERSIKPSSLDYAQIAEENRL